MTITFDKKLAELDAYLQMLIEQSETLDKKIDSAKNEPEKDGLELIKTNLQDLLASIKHAIVLLQIAKVSIRTDTSSTDSVPSSSPKASKPPSSTVSRGSLFEGQQQYSPQPPARRLKQARSSIGGDGGSGSSSFSQPNVTSLSASSPNAKVLASATQATSQLSSSSSNRKAFSPSQSVSLHSNQNESAERQQKCNSEPDLDEDDTFYDAAELHSHSTQLSTADAQNNNIVNPEESIVENDRHISFDSCGERKTTISKMTNNSNNKENSSSIDWDSMYDEEEEDLGSLEGEGSVIRHLLSQIRIGMDLTKVVLPTFILERRSLLEMYADFFAHPDLFSSIPDYESPEERMIQIVKWYLSAFHAGRKSSIAKKPYNPILGEIFLCHWNLDGNDSVSPKSTEESSGHQNSSQDSSEPSISDIETFSKRLPKGSLLFVAEQVSHHPPVSAFYAENPDKQISCCAHIYTKSKYLGLSVGVHNIGKGVISVLRHNETYVCTFPSAYGRSILTVPWVELGGSVNITCEQTGYSANIEFATKPFYGGKKNRVTGEILRPNKEIFLTIDGEWNGCMYYKSPPNSKDNKVFVDTTSLPVIKKNVRSISCQESYESRNVWKEVTRALKLHDVNSATAAKSYIEQRQRDLLKERTDKGVDWETRYFQPAAGTQDDGWSYAKPLADRLKETN